MVHRREKITLRPGRHKQTGGPGPSATDIPIWASSSFMRDHSYFILYPTGPPQVPWGITIILYMYIPNKASSSSMRDHNYIILYLTRPPHVPRGITFPLFYVAFQASSSSWGWQWLYFTSTRVPNWINEHFFYATNSQYASVTLSLLITTSRFSINMRYV